MKLDILAYPHPVLAKKAEPVAEITEDLKKLADDMAETMYADDGIGLAAPQVGESIRFIVVDVSGPDKRTDLMCLVNPVIESAEGEVETEEGCLSVPNLRTMVKRAEKVVVRARNLDNEEVVIDADELLAVCLQHEIDHLEGTLIIDRISRLKRSLYEKKVKKWQKRAQKDPSE